MKLCVVGIVAILVLLPGVSSAYNVAKTVVAEPYEVVQTTYDIDSTEVLLGALEGYPVMYEFEIDRTIDIQLQLLQRYRSQSVEPVPFSLIMVRDKDGGGGVAEIGRLRDGGEAGWQVAEYTALGIDAFHSELFTATIGPGTYRVEVSTPVNEGRYALLMGSEAPFAGYFTTIGNVYTTQQHFGYSVFYLLTSSYVFYPLGILLLLIIIQRTWKLRHKISNLHVA